MLLRTFSLCVLRQLIFFVAMTFAQNARASSNPTANFDLLVIANRAQQMGALADLNSECQLLTTGTYSKGAPRYGTSTSKIVNQLYSGQVGQPVCATSVVDNNALYYTWTGSQVGQAPTDNYTVTWTGADQIYNVAVTAVLFPRIDLLSVYPPSDVTSAMTTTDAGQSVELVGGDLGSTSVDNWTSIPGTWIGPPGFQPQVSDTANSDSCLQSQNCPGAAFTYTGNIAIYWVRAPALGASQSIPPEVYSTSTAAPNEISLTSTVNASATTTVSVAMPTDYAIPPDPMPGTVTLYPQSTPGTYVVGFSGGNPAIYLFTNATGPSVKDPGTIYWYQTIDHFTRVYYTTNDTKSCVIDPGLDTSDPYSSGSQVVSDVPHFTVTAANNSYSRLSQKTDFTTYLMWKPTQQSTFSPVTPVALGYVKWSWTGDITQTSKNIWELTPVSDNGQNGLTIDKFVDSFNYPQWSYIVDATKLTLKCTTSPIQQTNPLGHSK